MTNITRAWVDGRYPPPGVRSVLKASDYPFSPKQLVALLRGRKRGGEELSWVLGRADTEFIDLVFIHDPPLPSAGAPTSPLHEAADTGNIEAARALARHEVALDATDKDRLRPLHIAAMRGDAAMVAELCALGADVNARARDGSTPLHLCAAGCVDAVERLIAGGAKLDRKDGAGATPLMVAVTTGVLPVVQRLLAAGADTDVQDKEGETALHRAVWRDRSELIELLLSAGADAAKEGEDGLTPRMLARKLKRGKCLRKLPG